MAQINIIFKLSVTIRHDEEAGAFVSHCPLLNIFSQGDSEEEAKEAVKEAVSLQLNALYQFDRLHQLLLRSGFTSMSGKASAPDLNTYPGQYIGVLERDAKAFEIEVPLTLVAAAAAANNPSWQLSR